MAATGQKCQAILKSGKRKGQKCCSNAKHLVNDEYVCGRHYKTNKGSNSKVECQAVLKTGKRKGKHCGNVSKFNIEGVNLCGRHYRPEVKKTAQTDFKRCSFQGESGFKCSNEAVTGREYCCDHLIEKKELKVECHFVNCLRQVKIQSVDGRFFCRDHTFSYGMTEPVIGFSKPLEESEILWGQDNILLHERAGKLTEYGIINSQFRGDFSSEGIFSCFISLPFRGTLINHFGACLGLASNYRFLSTWEDNVYLYISDQGRLAILDRKTFRVKKTKFPHYEYGDKFFSHYLFRYYVAGDRQTFCTVCNLNSGVRKVIRVPGNILKDSPYMSYNGQLINLIDDSVVDIKGIRFDSLKFVNPDNRLVIYRKDGKMYYRYDGNDFSMEVSSRMNYSVHYNGCYVVIKGIRIVLPHLGQTIDFPHPAMTPVFTGKCQWCLLSDTLQKRCASVIRQKEIDASIIPKIIQERFYLTD